MSTECVYNPNSKRLIKVGSRLYKTLVRDAIIVDGKFQDWHRESSEQLRRRAEPEVRESESESMRFVPTLSEDESRRFVPTLSEDESRRFVPTLSQDFML